MEDSFSSIFIPGIDIKTGNHYEQNIVNAKDIIENDKEIDPYSQKEKNNQDKKDYIARKTNIYGVEKNLFYEPILAGGSGRIKTSLISPNDSVDIGHVTQTSTGKEQPSSRKIFGTVSQSIILVDSSNHVFFYEFLLPRHFPSLRDDGQMNPTEITSYREGVQSYFHFTIQPMKAIK